MISRGPECGSFENYLFVLLLCHTGDTCSAWRASFSAASHSSRYSEPLNVIEFECELGVDEGNNFERVRSIFEIIRWFDSSVCPAIPIEK